MACTYADQVLAPYSFSQGVAEAKSDAELMHAQVNLHLMVEDVLAGHDLTFIESPNIDLQTLIDSFEIDGLLAELILMRSEEGAEPEMVGLRLEYKKRERLTQIIKDHFAEYGELPEQYQLHKAA